MISSYYAADDIQAAGNPLGMQPNASAQPGDACAGNRCRNAARRVLSGTTRLPSAAAEMASAARSNEGRGRPVIGRLFAANPSRQVTRLNGLSIERQLVFIR